MELLWLKYFKAVTETGKISAAAEKLFISPPSLSATINRLEKELDVRLFDRSNNSITLNEQGRIFLRYTDQILSCLDLAKDELRQSLEMRSSHISVASTLSNLWVGLICAFSAEWPQITISSTSLKLSQLSSSNLPPNYSFLLAEEHDMPDTSGFNSMVLIDDDRPVLMVNPNHPLAKEAGVDLRDLVNENFFLPVADMSLNKMVRELLALANIRYINANEYPYMLRKGLLSENRGISFSTEHTSKSEDQSICYIPIENPSCRQRHLLFWDKNRVLSSEEKTFLSFCRDYFGVSAQENS